MSGLGVGETLEETERRWGEPGSSSPAAVWDRDALRTLPVYAVPSCK